MFKQKKPYVKPEFTIIPAGTPKYVEIMNELKAETTPQQPLEKDFTMKSNKEAASV